MNLPVTYPRKKPFKLNSNLEIMIATLRSYSHLDLNKVKINIDLSEFNMNDEEKMNIKNIISDFFKNTKTIIINLHRPSTLENWILESQEIEKFFLDEPVIVIMNHDHPFIDLNKEIFSKIVQTLFDNTEKSFHNVLNYSCIPENITRSFKPSNKKNFNGHNYYKVVNNIWLDSLCVMRIKTLKYLFNNMEFKGSYMGRFDWYGVKFKKLNINTYTYCREFFKHADGYGNVSNVREISEVSSDLDDWVLNKFLENLTDTDNYYYQKYIDTFYLTIRNHVKKKYFFIPWIISYKEAFVEIIETTLEEFKKTYIELDYEYSIINLDQKIIALNNLDHQVYYNFNNIVRFTIDDIRSFQKSYFYLLKEIIHLNIRKFL